MSAFVANITIEQGTDFETSYNIFDPNSQAAVDVSSYSVISRMKHSYYADTFINLNATFVSQVFGIVRIKLTALESKNIKPGRYVYDIILVSPGGIKKRVVEGVAEVIPGVTL